MKSQTKNTSLLCIFLFTLGFNLAQAKSVPQAEKETPCVLIAAQLALRAEVIKAGTLTTIESEIIRWETDYITNLYLAAGCDPSYILRFLTIGDEERTKKVIQ